MADIPNDAPEHCPGTTSEDAGKASMCAGCPNQTLCASGATKEPDPGIARVKERLSTVKNKILVLSGKGGVGKSTVTALVSRCLAAKDPDINVAVLDIDICGPSQPRVLGALGEQVHQSGSGWSPVYIEDNLSLMSIGFLLGSPSDAVIWRGPKKNGMIRQFLSDVDWGNLDYLIMDTPPGTSDEHLSATSYLKDAVITGAIIVTTPQQVALLDVRKEIDFCRKVNVPILGVIENMSIFVCPNCKASIGGDSIESRVTRRSEQLFTQKYTFKQDSVEIFPASKGGGGRGMAQDLDVDFLGSLPLDPRLTRCCDEGRNFLTEFPESPTVLALQKIVQKIAEKCEGKNDNCL